jgi:dihydroorotate dehydrogenase
MYRIIRSLLFLFDPEKVHYFSMGILKSLCGVGIFNRMITNWFRPVSVPAKPFPSASLAAQLFKNCSNPVGLGAGFDKNAKYLRELKCLGFGFVEIGTVTPIAQDGNDKPRLFRLKKDFALINRMGFNNDGADAILERLKKWKEKNIPKHNGARFLVGGNIGKNKNTANEEAWKDYLTCFEILHPYVDYFVVNVSSPNTPALRALQDKESLRKIFTVLNEANNKIQIPKPILLKIAPDLEKSQVDDVIALIPEIELEGLIVSNTTLYRSNLITGENELNKIGAGGLSGKPLQDKSTQMIRYIHEKTGNGFLIIGSGGIFTGADAQAKLDAGATLIQVWTGFVYEGPAIVKNISAYIAKRNKSIEA